MGLFDLISNTVEGVAQVAVNAGKLVVSPFIAPLDDGQAVEDAAAGIADGMAKIGDAEAGPPPSRG